MTHKEKQTIADLLQCMHMQEVVDSPGLKLRARDLTRAAVTEALKLVGGYDTFYDGPRE